jgi:hypothetical protein
MLPLVAAVRLRLAAMVMVQPRLVTVGLVQHLLFPAHQSLTLVVEVVRRMAVAQQELAALVVVVTVALVVVQLLGQQIPAVVVVELLKEIHQALVAPASSS